MICQDLSRHSEVHRWQRQSMPRLVLCCLVWMSAPTFAYSSELASSKITAEIKVDLAFVKAGPGSAYVDRGRLYKGDRVQILGRENLSDWVRIRFGKLEAYVALKVLRFKTRATKNIHDPNVVRRQSDYDYDDNGFRIDLGGNRVGSGETKREPTYELGIKENRNRRRVRLESSFGVGQLQRRFQSNSETRSLLSMIEASPTVFCSRFTGEYLFSEFVSLQLSLLDYRFGITTLATTALNEGNPFDVTNDGQLFDANLLARFTAGRWNFKGGIFVGLHRHAFQETLPLAVFLSSTSSLVGGALLAELDFGFAQLGLDADLAKVLSASQSPVSGGSFNDGQLVSFAANASVPVNEFLSILLRVESYEISASFVGESTQIDNLTDPDQPLTYTASEETNRLSSFVFGIRWVQ